MIIENANKAKLVEFVALKAGDVFLYQENYYMKTTAGGQYNAVSLHSGRLFIFEADKFIQHLPNTKLLV